MRIKIAFSGCLWVLLTIMSVNAQNNNTGTNSGDSLRLTLSQAESIFIKNNLQILNQKYNIDAAHAAVLQAKIWDNPGISIQQNIYNPDTKTYLETAPIGETAGSIDQLIVIGGKRNKRIQIAKMNEKISEFQYFDLIRTLKYSLVTTFTDLYFERESLSIYDTEMNSLRKILEVYTDQEKKGNVSFKDLIRIKAQLFSLENEKAGLLIQIQSNEHDLRILLSKTDSSKIIPVLDPNNVSAISLNVTYTQIRDSLLKNRYDLKAADATVALNNLNVELQRKIPIPDLDLGFNYDQRGSFVVGYQALSIGMVLPVWDQNQQQIKIAQYQTEQAKLSYKQALNQAYNDMQTAYQQAATSENLYKKFDASLPQELQNLNKSVTENFEKKNIGLLEFLDYYDAYKQNIILVNQLEDNRLKALENLNFIAGSNLFKL